MDFPKLVAEARTCRRFDQSRPLAQEDINWLLECARLAPSARNAQPLRFVSATEGPVLRVLFPLARWAAALKDWPGPGEGERPTAMIAALTPARSGALVCYDVGICCQTIQLAAASRGWGCCIMGSFDRPRAAGILNVPADMELALLIWLGVAKEIRKAEDMPADGSYQYWRDAAGAHHVPKRSVGELLLGSYH